jgi:hypothetical protein
VVLEPATIMAGSKDPKKAVPGEKKTADGGSKSGSKSSSRSPLRHVSQSPTRRGRSEHHGRELVIRERVARDVSGGT